MAAAVALLNLELKLASTLLATAPAEEVMLWASEARLEVMLPRLDSTEERTEERALLVAMAEPATEVRELNYGEVLACGFGIVGIEWIRGRRRRAGVDVGCGGSYIREEGGGEVGLGEGEGGGGGG